MIYIHVDLAYKSRLEFDQKLKLAKEKMPGLFEG